MQSPVLFVFSKMEMRENDKFMKIYEKVSLIFTGIVYLAVGLLIIFYPELLYYGVAGVFFVQGISLLFRAIISSTK